ncbi:probable protein NAP1 [Humulus lupulus]|uniref:probable protein NAP1 n=1 Tax=Humulus lupulus TaxID=3486 RepID=UPI002B40C67B|nr:probable protein NAP1 [Humulus lupulus]
MKLFEGGELDRKVMEKASCQNYSHTPWESEKGDVYERQTYYKFDKCISRYRGETRSTKQRSPISDSIGWIIEEFILLILVLIIIILNLYPYHPRYPDILTNSAHPMRAQDLANVTSYREWVLFGYLVCPDELLHVTSIDIAMVVLKENLVLTLFRDEYILLHEEYQLYVLPRILESKRTAKSGRTKQKEEDLEYSVAKQVEKMISE